MFSLVTDLKPSCVTVTRYAPVCRLGKRPIAFIVGGGLKLLAGSGLSDLHLRPGYGRALRIGDRSIETGCGCDLRIAG